MDLDDGQKPLSADPFTDLDAYVALPRVGGLRLSPDGRRLVVGVATPDRKFARYATALWEVDPDPRSQRPARRLTRSGSGESAAAFTPDGDLLFTSKRPDPDGDPDGDPVTALWRQPAAGGDAYVVAGPAGGVQGVVVSETGTVVVGSGLMPSSGDVEEDRELRKKRKDGGVAAILHEEYPIRYWDHDLGPEQTRLFEVEDGQLRDITGHVGSALGDRSSWHIAPDGRTIVVSWAVPEDGGALRLTIVAVDVATGERRTLADDPDHEYGAPRVSPDGTRVAVVVSRRASHDGPGDSWLATVPLEGGPVEHLTREWDRWPQSPRWVPDGSAIVVAADDNGRSPLWKVTGGGEVTKLTEDNGAYSDYEVSPDGRWIYAIRSAVDSPPAPVRIPADGGPAEPLRGPAEDVPVPGRLEEVTATADDGTPLRAWLALPAREAGEQAPLLLWIHGGPLRSWNAWSWRWNPWVAVAAGYAVLLPDPALSTGYGIDFIERGWGHWGKTPFTDLMTITDAAVERSDIDAERTAAMGGSFGGYMANWVAGHTDRFDAIVTHASLWSLDQMMNTTDAAFFWKRELSPDRIEANSPDNSAGSITTPMLVIHGDKDYRVPIGEALRLWWDLKSRKTQGHKFLYFPDEGHWILKPGHVKVWYETVLAFLAHHVRGEEWKRPANLG